jgi:hypothetical protein
MNQQGTENANVEEDVPNGGDGASQPHVASDRDGGGQFENDEPQMDDDCEGMFFEPNPLNLAVTVL